MIVCKRRRLAERDRGTLPPEMLEEVLKKVDVGTKQACAVASPALKQLLKTTACWPQAVRVDLRDSRQLWWLQQHIEVLERLKICLDYSLIGRFNRLLRHRQASRLTSLSILMTPDDTEDTRMQLFELRGLRLVVLDLHHRGENPVFSTHQLPTTLRSLVLADVQESDAHFFIAGEDMRDRDFFLPQTARWSFATQLPASVTRLRLVTANYLDEGLELLKQRLNLEVLDVDLGSRMFFKKTELPSDAYNTDSDGDDPVGLANTLTSLGLRRAGLHASSGCVSFHVPHFNIAEMHRTFYIGPAPYFTLEEQIDQGSHCRVTKLTLHVYRVLPCPSLSGYSALKELVIGDVCWKDNYYQEALSLSGLEAVAATLTHLTVSSSREMTVVHLPIGLRLLSFICVCGGKLELDCDADTLGQGLADVLLGYATIGGTGVRLVNDLRPGLGRAVLKVHEAKRLSLSLLFTRPELVGDWWYGVFQVSKQHNAGGRSCCRMRVWAEGCLCPPYLTFPRYGIVSAHDERDVLRNEFADSKEHSYMEKYLACMTQSITSMSDDSMSSDTDDSILLDTDDSMSTDNNDDA